MTNFKQRLREAGYTGETDQFYHDVDILFAIQFANFETDEQLKRQPREALRFCDIVRTHFNLPALSDEIILGVQENYRRAVPHFILACW